MPVIGHEDKRKQLDRVFLQPFTEDSNERLVVLWFLEDGLPVVAAIESVVDDARLIGSLLSWHAISREVLLGN